MKGFRPSVKALGNALLLLVLALLAFGSSTGCGGRAGGGASSAATQTETARDECTDTTYSPNYASYISLVYWPVFPLQVYFDTTSPSYTADLQARAITAFNGWVAATNGAAAYVVVTDPTEADITVGFVPVTSTLLTNYDADGITYFYPGTSSAATTDLQFASVEVYIGIDGATTRENGTMAHEFGHALGIHGHSLVSTDLMYRSWSATRSQTPTNRDTNTLDTAYCDIFSRAQAPDAPVVLHHHAPFPPLSDPGWQAIP